MRPTASEKIVSTVPGWKMRRGSFSGPRKYSSNVCRQSQSRWEDWLMISTRFASAGTPSSARTHASVQAGAPRGAATDAGAAARSARRTESWYTAPVPYHPIDVLGDRPASSTRAAVDEPVDVRLPQRDEDRSVVPEEGAALPDAGTGHLVPYRSSVSDPTASVPSMS